MDLMLSTDCALRLLMLLGLETRLARDHKKGWSRRRERGNVLFRDHLRPFAVTFCVLCAFLRLFSFFVSLCEILSIRL